MKHISEIINEERNKFPFLMDEVPDEALDDEDEEELDEFDEDYDFSEDDDEVIE